MGIRRVIVKAVSRFAQRHIIGGDNRPLSDRRIALFCYVIKQVNRDGKRPSWNQLMKEWNMEYLKWEYKDVRNMSRDYNFVERALIKPDHKTLDATNNNSESQYI